MPFAVLSEEVRFKKPPTKKPIFTGKFGKGFEKSNKKADKSDTSRLVRTHTFAAFFPKSFASQKGPSSKAQVRETTCDKSSSQSSDETTRNFAELRLPAPFLNAPRPHYRTHEPKNRAPFSNSIYIYIYYGKGPPMRPHFSDFPL